MTFFIFLICLKVILLGAVYGRLDGGGFVKTPEWIERSLIMFFFVLACAPFAGLWSLLAYVGVFGIATGHGQYFPGLAVKYIKPEFFDFLVKPIFGKDPRTDKTTEVKKAIGQYGERKLYWRCAFGMFVTGTVVGLPAFLLCMAFGKVYGAIFLLTGVVKTAAYLIGWKLFKSTEPAEYINGGGRNVLCLAVIYFALMTGN